ncbi:hypothetical protein ACFL52_04200 [Candidatus Margulisiibacteriota bacterium]
MSEIFKKVKEGGEQATPPLKQTPPIPPLPISREEIDHLERPVAPTRPGIKMSEMRGKDSLRKLQETEAYDLFLEIISLIGKGYEKLEDEKKEFEGMTQLVLANERFVDQQILNNEAIFNLLILCNRNDCHICHTLNVSFIAVEVASGLNLPRTKLIELSVAALLFDIALMKFSDFAKIDKPKTIKEYRDRFEKRVKESKVITESDKSAKERIMAVIILAEIYATLIYPPFKEPACTPHETFKKIIIEKGLFDKPILKSFIERIGPYPVGTMVRLSSGEKGRVIKRNLTIPLRPTVRIFSAVGGQDLKEEKILDLLEHPTIYIKSHLSADEAQ